MKFWTIFLFFGLRLIFFRRLYSHYKHRKREQSPQRTPLRDTSRKPAAIHGWRKADGAGVPVPPAFPKSARDQNEPDGRSEHREEVSEHGTENLTGAGSWRHRVSQFQALESHAHAGGGFGLPETSSSSSSRLIKEAIGKNLIKILDPNTAPRYMKYIPIWA